MSCQNYNSILLKFLNRIPNFSSRHWIQTSCWFVQENQTGIGNKFDTDGGTLSLTTRNTLNKGTTDSSVLTLREFEGGDDEVNTRHFLFFSSGQLESSGKLETLADSHGLEKDIVLLDVGGVSTEVWQGLLFNTIYQDFACLFEVHGNFTSGEEVKESGFTST